MNIKNISFAQIKQQFSDNAQKLGNFCGRKVEVLKAKSSEAYQATHARVAAFASYSFAKISSAWNTLTTGCEAAKTFVVTKISQACSNISEVAAKIFKKKAPVVSPALGLVPVAPKATVAPAPEAPAAEAPAAKKKTKKSKKTTTSPAPAEAPAADVSRSGRQRKKTVRFGF